jgi:hypothetical protein
VAVCLTIAVSAGCSRQSSPPVPTGPTPGPAQAVDLTGRWVRYDANGRPTEAWQLVQRDGAIEGTPFIYPDDEVPTETELTGTLAGSEFTFSAVVTDHWPDRDVRTRVEGVLTVTSDVMSGRATFIPGAGRPGSGEVRFFRVAP